MQDLLKIDFKKLLSLQNKTRALLSGLFFAESKESEIINKIYGICYDEDACDQILDHDDLF